MHAGQLGTDLSLGGISLITSWGRDLSKKKETVGITITLHIFTVILHLVNKFSDFGIG